MLENKAAELGPSKFSWWKDWHGECVAIVASGPSVKKAEVEKLRNRIHVIAINESWQLAPWADILYGADGAWWKLRGGVPEFKGLKITQDEKAAAKYGLAKITVAKVNHRYIHEILTDEPGCVGAGGHSGFQADNLAIQFGATGILLVGFDMQGLHWHGRHPQPLSNPMEDNFKRWRAVLDGQAVKFKALGVDVVNCSPVSALKEFPKMTVEAALERWRL